MLRIRNFVWRDELAPTVKLPFFPTSLPDETIFSLKNRYRILTGYQGAEKSCEKLMFSRALSTQLRASSIWHLVKQMPGNRAKNFRLLLERNSLIRLDYLGSDKRIDRELCLLDVESFKFCRDCIIEDRQQLGVSYWHRSHQVDGVACCWRHHVYLDKKLVKKGYSYSSCLPCEIFEGRDFIAGSTCHPTKFEVKYAKMVNGLLMRPVHVSLRNFWEILKHRSSTQAKARWSDERQTLRLMDIEKQDGASIVCNYPDFNSKHELRLELKLIAITVLFESVDDLLDAVKKHSKYGIIQAAEIEFYRRLEPRFYTKLPGETRYRYI